MGRERMFYYWPILVVAAFAVFFYRAAEHEGAWGVLWGGLSVVISVAALWWLHWGFWGVIAGQAALYVAIGLCRAIKEEM